MGTRTCSKEGEKVGRGGGRRKGIGSEVGGGEEEGDEQLV